MPLPRFIASHFILAKGGLLGGIRSLFGYYHSLQEMLACSKRGRTGLLRGYSRRGGGHEATPRSSTQSRHSSARHEGYICAEEL